MPEGPSPSSSLLTPLPPPHRAYKAALLLLGGLPLLRLRLRRLDSAVRQERCAPSNSARGCSRVHCWQNRISVGLPSRPGLHTDCALACSSARANGRE